MLPLYCFTLDIISHDTEIDEEQFRLQVEPYLSCLASLQGMLSNNPCKLVYYPPSVEYGTLGWSARGIVMISVGKKRAAHFVRLCHSIVEMIDQQLDDFDVTADVSELQF